MSIFNSFTSFLPTFQSNAFLPRDDKFQLARQQAQADGFSNILGALGRVGNSFAAAWKAKDYEEKAAEARAAAYRNAQIVAQAQMESNLKLAQYESDRRMEAARLLDANVPKLLQAASETREQGRRAQAQALGRTKAQYASSGVQVGTGSSRLVMQDVLRETDLAVSNEFEGMMTQIQDTANAAARERLEAQFAVWSAEEQNRFINANVQMRLS